MAEEKKFPPPEMLKAREVWANMPEEEKKALRDASREELRRRAKSGFPLHIKMELENLDE